MRELILYEDYSREEVHDIFDPESTFISQRGAGGLWGIIELPDRPRDYVFFVTFGQKQAEHEFDEGITADGILRWQSQPQQHLEDSTIRNFISHDEDRNSIYLFLRTGKRRAGSAAPYTYLGRLKYLVHDHDREEPVYFTWQILDWHLPEHVRERMQLTYEGAVSQVPEVSPAQNQRGLVQVYLPKALPGRGGVSTIHYNRRLPRDYAEQDARNRRLGRAGEELVLESERLALITAGRPDLAERIVHVARVEGDGAGYDIKSFTPEGDEMFIEVKTTRGDERTAFYISAGETRFAAEHTDHYYLYRIFDFDETLLAGKFFVNKGDLPGAFSLKPIQFKVQLAGVERECD